jgi:hypothetical protein
MMNKPVSLMWPTESDSRHPLPQTVSQEPQSSVTRTTLQPPTIFS